MRKLPSILFLFVLAFNIAGSYGVFMGLRLHNERKMVRSFDEGRYDDGQTMTLKLPITVPYATDSREYSRVDGSFKLDGQSYRLVKQALVKDTLHIVCIKDEKATAIDNILATIVETFSDNPTTSKSQSLTLTDFIKEYINTSLVVVTHATGWHREVSHVTYNLSSASADQASVIHPPERV